MESSHITYAPELHWRMAARWNQMTWEEFIEMEGEDQSKAVATYETALQIDAVQTTDANRKVKHKPGKGGT